VFISEIDENVPKLKMSATVVYRPDSEIHLVAAFIGGVSF
jgi:hypothetical protein